MLAINVPNLYFFVLVFDADYKNIINQDILSLELIKLLLIKDFNFFNIILMLIPKVISKYIVKILVQ